MNEVISFLGLMTLSAFTVGFLAGCIWLSVIGWKIIFEWIKKHGG